MKKKILLGLGAIAMALTIGLTFSTANQNNSYLSENLEVLTIEEAGNGYYCHVQQNGFTWWHTTICDNSNYSHCLGVATWTCSDARYICWY
jgi:hypothetical protein